MTSRQERLSDLQWAEENWGEYVLWSALYQSVREHDSMCMKLLQETLRTALEGTPEQQQILNAAGRLLAAWRSR